MNYARICVAVLLILACGMFLGAYEMIIYVRTEDMSTVGPFVLMMSKLDFGFVQKLILLLSTLLLVYFVLPYRKSDAEMQLGINERARQRRILDEAMF
jgi:hypothetical protein